MNLDDELVGFGVVPGGETRLYKNHRQRQTHHQLSTCLFYRTQFARIKYEIVGKQNKNTVISSTPLKEVQFCEGTRFAAVKL